METFEANGKQHKGYLALPSGGEGPGLLLLHAWWGLTDLFKDQADKYAAEGYVVFAPDLFDGAQASEPAEAEKLVQAASADFPAVKAAAEAAARFLQNHPAVTSDKLTAVGFSFGAAYALVLDEALPDVFGKVVLFYGMAGADVSKSQAKYLAHFAENDPFEDTEAARCMNAANLERHIYPNTGHWFYEHNRADAYNAEAADLAWQRTITFLKG
ncbi:MAG: dienelactone hydrolase family protein [Anaerolineales bacterium]|nr:MAG: dienelactone hydrolase family protein [Anaerolineales bacterium]